MKICLAFREIFKFWIDAFRCAIHVNVSFKIYFCGFDRVGTSYVNVLMYKCISFITDIFIATYFNLPCHQQSSSYLYNQVVSYGSLVLHASVSDLILVLYTISRFVVPLSGLTCQHKRETWDTFLQRVVKVCSLCMPVHIICSKMAYPYISVMLHCNYIHIPANKFLHSLVIEIAEDNLNTWQLRERNNKMISWWRFRT
jgi:hypothetical protein